MNKIRNYTDTEFELAKKIGELLLPKSSPVCTWCCVGVKNRMAKGLGGDYYDFISMPDGCQALFIGDVTGHGIHASIVMALVYGFMHRATQGECDPLEIVRQVNRFLLSFGNRSKTIDHYFSSTLFFGIIDPQSLKMAYVNAGHVAPLLLRNGMIGDFVPTGPPVGFFDHAEYGTAAWQFERGDRLLLLTDGIIESGNPSGELFGLERIHEILRNGVDDYDGFLRDLFGSLDEFTGSAQPRDDCTAIVIDMHGPLP
jgi:serine phosphatase RsbU (regulator of sigma subunit)